MELWHRSAASSELAVSRSQSSTWTPELRLSTIVLKCAETRTVHPGMGASSPWSLLQCTSGCAKRGTATKYDP